MFRRFILFFVFLFSFIGVQAQLQLFSSELQKGFKALDKNNYDKALEIFSSVTKDDSADAGADYGMAEIYFSKNYSGNNIDKAYKDIILAQNNFSNADRKELSALARLEIDQSHIDQLKQKIDDELFSVAVSQNSAASYSEFISKYPDNPNVEKAKELREQLSLFKVTSGNSEDAINDFIKSNPNSKDVKKAINVRNLVAFQKAKEANTIQAMKDFIAKYPDAEEMDQATEALASLEFQQAKDLNTIAAYDSFLLKYPDADEAMDATKQRNQLAYIQVLEIQKSKDSAALLQTQQVVDQRGTALTYGFIGLLILLLVLGLLYRSYNQKKRSNIEITSQKEIIEVKNREIVDSINYAKRIQDSILPMVNDIKQNLPDSFVFFKPRNIVSGDFYWFAKQGNKMYVAAVDCTGHGVPGALVSMIGFNFLTQLVSESNIDDPGEILNHMHSKVSLTLNKEGNVSPDQVRDGMDIALLCIDRTSNSFSYAGAVRPLYYIDENGLNIIKGGYYSIGGIKSLTENPFVTQTVKPKGKATFYLFSDGYADQFGGPNGKKFKMKKFQELLLSIVENKMHEQHQKIESAFHGWMGNQEQVDDVCVIGIRV
jgi:serine phosphatase RsbU (regulator of sigma subunit)/outer membrane protein assembly factor BamD (BamD/ComL family)